MRRAKLRAWLSEVELMEWVRTAEAADDCRRRLAVWLTYLGGHRAAQIAELLCVSVQAVWLWLGQYNREGPGGLRRQGRGGRRWGYLTTATEGQLLAQWERAAGQGQVITAKGLHAHVCQAVGRQVSLGYVYRLLHRHGWRKLGPRARHVKGDPQAQQQFKKNSPA
jgi:transposase